MSAALTDAEWREFQRIPEQGYSHRAWVDARIAERLASAWDDGYDAGIRLMRDAEHNPNPYRTTKESK